LLRPVIVKGAVTLFFLLCNLTDATATVTLAAEKIFDLSQAVEFALQNNGELKALREELGIREAGRIRAGLYPNPVLEMEGTTGELMGSRFENALSVGISQEFLTAGKREKRLQVAVKERESFARQIDNASRLLSAEVKTIFSDLLLAEKRTGLAGRSLALNAQLLRVAKERFAAGDIPELEVNLARVEVARSEGRKVEAERDLHPAKARLFALMGFSPGEEVGFSGTLEEGHRADSLSDLIEAALAKRPDLQALEAEKAKSDAEIALAKAERTPNVTAGFGLRREYTAIEVGENDVKDQDNLIGLKVSIPLPLFDRNQAGIREAQARRGSAGNRYLFARKTIAREVEAAYARLKTAEKSLSIYAKDIIPQLEENLQLVQEAYRLGEVGILTVIEEQKKFFEVNDSYLAALHDRRTVLVKLETAVGVDLHAESPGGKK